MKFCCWYMKPGACENNITYKTQSRQGLGRTTPYLSQSRGRPRTPHMVRSWASRIPQGPPSRDWRVSKTRIFLALTYRQSFSDMLCYKCHKVSLFFYRALEGMANGNSSNTKDQKISPSALYSPFLRDSSGKFDRICNRMDDYSMITVWRVQNFPDESQNRA